MNDDWIVVLKELAIDVLNAMLDYWVITLIIGTLIWRPFFVLFGIVKMVTTSKERREK